MIINKSHTEGWIAGLLSWDELCVALACVTRMTVAKGMDIVYKQWQMEKRMSLVVKAGFGGNEGWKLLE